MNKKLMGASICIICLGACTPPPPPEPTYYSNVSYRPYTYESTFFRAYDSGTNYRWTAPVQENHADSYYVGDRTSPVSHKDVDKEWVRSQNPNAYTIEISDEEKASHVASKLQQVPKNDRSAEIKYNRQDGSSSYKGVYGSFNNYEEAQKAYNNLPEDIKQGANIKTWNNIQPKISD